MRYTTVYLLEAMVLAGLLACSSNPAGPDGGGKDPRLYTWSADTLAFPGSLQTIMFNIWGSSPNDVYTVGHNERGFGMMYHYDGTNWQPVSLPILDAGSPSFTDIQGFAENDIWAVGRAARSNFNPPPDVLHTGFVLHYDGSGWKKQAVPLPDSNGTNLFAVGGSSSSNLFAGGRNGLMFHYNGTRWQPAPLPSELLDPNPHWEYGAIAIEGNPQTGEVFMLYKAPSLDRYLLKHEDGEWQILKNMHQSTIYADLWMSPWGKLYAAVTGDVQVWNGTDWEFVLLDEAEARASGFQATGLHGFAEDNFFVVGADQVFHYNGIDRFAYKDLQFPSAMLDMKVWSGDEEVFVLVQDVSSFPMVTIILHGK